MSARSGIVPHLLLTLATAARRITPSWRARRLLDGVSSRNDQGVGPHADLLFAATLSYDRLGVGRSAHPDGVQVVQSPYELAQAVTIGEMIRAGSFNNVPAYDTVVSIGHSYGSALVAGLTKVAPDLYNASVLTGFSANATTGPLGIAGFASVIANTAYPDRFANLSNAYLATPSVNADQQEFFHYPNFTADALTLFTTTKGEYTIGQINSVSEPPTMPSVGLYTAPTLVITGANDGPFCESRAHITPCCFVLTPL